MFVLGDSFTRGSLADETETIPAHLSYWSRDYDFLNFGTGGHGTSQHVLTYSDFRNLISHELILILIYIPNDLIDNVKFEKRKEKLQEQTALQRARYEMKGFLIEFLGNYEIGRFSLKVYSRLLSSVSKEDSISTDEQFKYFKKSIYELVKMIGNKRVFIATIPGRDEFDFSDRSHQDNPATYASYVRSIVSEIASIYKMPTLHLTKENLFENRPFEIDQLYGWPDRHFTERGYHRAAQEIGRWLQAEFGFNFRPAIEKDFIDRTSFDYNFLQCPS